MLAIGLIAVVWFLAACGFVWVFGKVIGYNERHDHIERRLYDR